jgi:phasin protein
MRGTSAAASSEAAPGFNLWLTPFILLNSWTPFLAGTSRWNHQAHEGLSTLSLEWQDFLARRFTEDAGLLKKIANSRSPDQLWASYASFWQKAMDDYGAEFARMTKLAAGVTAKNLAATQQAADEGLRHARQVAQAA